MTHRRNSNRHFTYSVCALLLITAPLSASEVNEAFVRSSLESFIAEALEELPLAKEEEIALDYAGPSWDDLNVGGSALFRVVRSTGFKISTQPDSIAPAGLYLRLSEIEFSYENQNGSLFSRGDLHRVLKVAGSFRLSRNRSPIWEDYLIREYREKIELNDRDRLEGSSSPLFSAELPPGPVQRLWEPVIVTAIVGGLVYLFFASR